ncbi:MAG: response regulator transcription factor [Magnetococcales bacterium]|nr:response regulator transcription factor [Magnetococcales bacterium]
MPRPPPLLSLLEDDPSLRFLMSSYLEKSGFRVQASGTAEAFFAAFDREPPDCLLLDLNLPDEDGLVVVRKLRYHSSVPLIIVSSRGGEQDRLAGIELGADDYVTKPFHPRELAARIRNLLLRSSRQGTGGPEPSPAVIRLRGWVLDLDQRRLEIAAGEPIPLTRGEFDCLATLVRARGAVVTRQRLKDAVTRRQDPPGDRTVDALVCRLRRKLRPAAAKASPILTVPGHGYQIDPSVLEG